MKWGRLAALKCGHALFYELLYGCALSFFAQSVSPTHVLPYPRRRARRGRALSYLTYPESSAPDAVLLARSVSRELARSVSPRQQPVFGLARNPTRAAV